MLEKIVNVKLMFFLGLLLFFLGVTLVWVVYNRKIINDGNIKVQAIILESPKDCNNISTKGGYCKLEYNGRVFVKRAGNKFCHLVSGKDSVIVYTNNQGSQLLFPGEYKPIDFIFSGIILVFSFITIIKALIGNNKKYNAPTN